VPPFLYVRSGGHVPVYASRSGPCTPVPEPRRPFCSKFSGSCDACTGPRGLQTHLFGFSTAPRGYRWEPARNTRFRIPPSGHWFGVVFDLGVFASILALASGA